MSALKPLMTLHECAERERDEAQSRFERARLTAQAAQEQAQALRTWRGDYEQRWKTQFQGGSSVEIIRCYQDFMNRLGQAIAEQDIAVERTKALLDSARAVLQAREQRVAAVSQLIDRRKREAAAIESRREQKATDEMAARRHGSRSGFGGFRASNHGDPTDFVSSMI